MKHNDSVIAGRLNSERPTQASIDHFLGASKAARGSIELEQEGRHYLISLQGKSTMSVGYLRLLEGRILALGIFAAATYLILAFVYYVFIRYDFTSPHRHLPGPKRSSWLTGNFSDIFNDEPGLVVREWQRKFGSVFRFGDFLGRDRLVFTDPVALNYILMTESYNYPKPTEARNELAMIIGKGILVAEGDDHKRQKRLLAPAFSGAHVDALAPIFIEKAEKLRSVWSAMVEQTQKSTEIEVADWLSRYTLDVIGSAGFGTELNTLDNSDHPMASAFHTLLKGQRPPRPAQILIHWLVMKLGIARYLPLPSIKRARGILATVRSESYKIIQQKSAEVDSEDFHGKDLITLLLRANRMADSASKMSSEEVMSQISTFMLAGSETSSVALSWALYYLSQHQDVQSKLRGELHDVKIQGKELKYENIASLPFLDSVTKEVLRLRPPVTATLRMAAKSDIIPLGRPIALRNGQVLSGVPIREKEIFQVSMGALAWNEDLWGPDCMTFRPERWLEKLPDNLMDHTKKGFTAWGHQLTFLGGPRTCIGYRMAVAEIKVALAILVSSFQFDPSPKGTVTYGFAIVTRPYIKEDMATGSQLPLLVSKCKT